MPSETILRTKLFTPPPRRNSVARPNILDKLADALCPETRLTLVCAPAGFGKSTVVAEWIATFPLNSQLDKEKPSVRIAWINLDEADNDPIRFWRYVDVALQTIDTRLGESIHSAIYAPQPPPFRTLLTELVNDILNVGIEFVLVLDDYHHIQNETIHETLNFLLDHLPPLAHLVITTRSDPPLQLARRRARGELCELRAADLRFNNEETGQFINEVMRLGLSTNDVAALESRTEGWIAGLQMAAISLQDSIDRHAFVTAFSGDDRYIADYLLEEVLQRQPIEFQHFLLQTSVLNRLNSLLCNHVTGRSDSQAVLNALERANLFVLPLDNRREWFRYHHLFASLLQQRLLDTSGSAAVLELKRRASQWHTAHGNLVDAVEIALFCGDYEQAVSIIEVSDGALFMATELNSLRQWSERLPSAIISAHPRLILMTTWANHATGQPQRAEQFVQLLEQTLGVTTNNYLEDSLPSREYSSQERSALLEGAAVRVRIAVDSLNLENAIALCGRILPRLVNIPGETYTFNTPENLRGPVLFCWGLAHELKGDLAEATRLFIEAKMDATEHKNAHILALALGHLGEIQTMQGKPELAQATYKRSLEIANSYPPFSSAFWSLASIGLGELALAQGNLNAAETHLRAGVELAKIWNAWECLLPGMLGQARIHAARGEWETAHATLDDLLERTTTNALMVRPAVEAELALFQLQQGNLEKAAQWASTFDSVHPSAYHLQWEQNALIATQIWLAQGKQSEAKALLSRLLADAKSAGRLAFAQRVRQITLDAQANTIQSHPQSIPSTGLKTFPRVLDSEMATRTRIEPLSERELEVLQLMASGLTNAEIARKLYLSTNTLKAHAQNIYQKLDVHSRMEAVNKARQLVLLK